LKLSPSVVIALSFLSLSSCSGSEGNDAGQTSVATESIYTELTPATCRTEIDNSDPNETPYQVCPGVAGYSLILRLVDSGRQSIDVVDPAQRVFPLAYHEFVTRHMSTIEGRAEWRVTTQDGRQVPIALIVAVHAREDLDNPETVTHHYLAVAKVAPNEACVTQTIVEGSRAESAVRSAADSAGATPCLAAQPPVIP
jgi:hypothetical protein